MPSRGCSAPPAPVSLHPTGWSGAVEADFRRAFPTNIVDRVLGRDRAGPHRGGRPSFARPRTIHNSRYSLALFEGMIADRFPRRLALPLREQVDRDTLRAFVEHLARTNRPRSVVDHLTRLIYLLRRLGLFDQALLARLERAGLRIPPRLKRRAPFTTAQLWTAGERLIAEAKARKRGAPTGRGRDAFLRATGERYRDGLILCFSALCIPRISNTRAMQIGRHLVHKDKVYVLHFPADEMKTKREVTAAVPEILVEHFELYIAVFRDLIRGAREHQQLWPSRRKARGLSLFGLHLIYKRHFRRILGVDAASHDCRRAAADCVTLDPRAPTNLAQLILQHRGDRTVWRYRSVSRGNLNALLSRLTGC